MKVEKRQGSRKTTRANSQRGTAKNPSRSTQVSNRRHDPALALARAIAPLEKLGNSFPTIEFRLPPALMRALAAVQKTAEPFQRLAQRLDEAQRPFREALARIDWVTIAERTARARRLIFEETGNPLMAWEEYRLSRSYDRPIPEWVLRYLDAAADKLHAIRCKELPKNLDATHAEALGMKRGGRKGGGSIYAADARFNRDCAVAESVLALVRTGTKESEAWLEVAKQYGMSEASARRAAKRYTRLVSTL